MNSADEIVTFRRQDMNSADEIVTFRRQDLILADENFFRRL